MKGICHLNRVTGNEHDHISRFLLALVADIRLLSGHSNGKLIRSVLAILDFIYLARYPIHTSETVNQMHDALYAFHQNRDIFISHQENLQIKILLNFARLCISDAKNSTIK